MMIVTDDVVLDLHFYTLFSNSPLLVLLLSLSVNMFTE